MPTAAQIRAVIKANLKPLKFQRAGWAAIEQAAAAQSVATKQAETAANNWGIRGLPDAIFVIDVGYHKIAITEAGKLGIPVIGVVDTNHSPEGVSYVIPGNDDSSGAIRLYARGVADAILEGKSQSINEVVQQLAGDDEFVEVEEAGE